MTRRKRKSEGTEREREERRRRGERHAAFLDVFAYLFIWMCSDCVSACMHVRQISCKLLCCYKMKCKTEAQNKEGGERGRLKKKNVREKEHRKVFLSISSGRKQN